MGRHGTFADCSVPLEIGSAYMRANFKEVILLVPGGLPVYRQCQTEEGQGEGGLNQKSLGDSAANFCGQSVVSAQFPVNNFVPVERQKAGELFDAVAQQFQRNKCCRKSS